MATALTNGKASSRRLIRHSLTYDASPRSLLNDPTPSKAAAILSSVDQGELWELCLLQIELERKWDQFAGVVQTRRNAITGLEWCIDPDPKVEEDDEFAKEVADYVSDKLASLDAWDTALSHLSEAIGPNLSVLELIWEKAELSDIAIVPCTRLASHPITNTGVVVRTDEVPMGMPTEEFPGKFVVFTPNSKGGFPYRATLTHASIRAFLMAWFSQTDWMAFSELYGTPERVAYYDDPVVDADRETIFDYIQYRGSDSAIALPKGVTLELHQAAGTGETYEKQLAHAESKIAILWRGQTLTTDIGSVGSRAAAEVHDRVSRDILVADIKAEAACIQRQIIRPMVALKYPGMETPIPVFSRKMPDVRDVESERLTLSQMEFAAKERLTVNTDWVYESLGIPKPQITLPETIVLGQVAADEAKAKAEALAKQPKGGFPNADA